MSTIRNPKPITTVLTVDVSQGLDLSRKIFTEVDNEEDIPARMDGLTLEEQITLHVTLSLLAQDISDRLKKADERLLANDDCSLQKVLGSSEANVLLRDTKGNDIGNMFFGTSKDKLNTEGSVATAEKVKKALVAAGLGSTYIKTQERLDNGKLKVAFDGGLLPASVASLLKVQHGSKNVDFKPNKQKGGN